MVVSDLARGDLARGDLARGDLARGDLARSAGTSMLPSVAYKQPRVRKRALAHFTRRYALILRCATMRKGGFRSCGCESKPFC